MKKGRRNRTQGRARRAQKSWTKGALPRHGDDEAVPVHSVPMKPRVKDIRGRERPDLEALLHGRVIDSSGRAWIVEAAAPDGQGSADDGALPTRYECVASRSIVSDNEGATLIAVGDNVYFKVEEVSGKAQGELPKGLIQQVGERSSRLSRKTAGKYSEEQVIACNIDQLIITMAAADPFYNKRLIDRYLVAAEYGELTPLIVINKIELMDEEFVLDDLSIYPELLAIPVLCTSANTNQGLEELAALMKGKTSVFSGPSGVGKSSLTNALMGSSVQAVSDVSKKTAKGMHTTSFSRMLRLPFGAYVVDTPGIREFGIWDVPAEELSFYFPDFEAFREKCRFAMCTHTHEPGCGVKAAVENEQIDPERYASYLNILESLST